MSLQERRAAKVRAIYDQHYYAFMLSMMKASDVGGQTAVKDRISSTDEMIHRTECNRYAEWHVTAHDLAMRQVGGKKDLLPADIATRILNADLPRFGTTLAEVNLQRIFAGLDKQEAELDRTIQRLGPEFEIEVADLRRLFPRHDEQKGRSEVLKSGSFVARHAINTLEMLGGQVERGYQDHPRVEELLGRLGTLFGRARAIIESVDGRLGSLEEKP